MRMNLAAWGAQLAIDRKEPLKESFFGVSKWWFIPPMWINVDL
jgi:hypothetical protein